MSRSAWDTVAGRLIWLDDGAAGLPGGLAGNRYVCPACREHVMLKGAKPDSKVAPHFAHQSSAECSAPDREAEIDALTEVVIALRDTIRAIPGITATLDLPDADDAGARSGLGPVIIARLGDTTIAIERPPTKLPEPALLRRRIQAVRERHPGASHVWFLKRDRLQFGKVGTVSARVNRQTVRYDTVAPTEQQLAIVAAGGHVCWLDGQLVLIPYGVHYFLHSTKPGQDWVNWEGWRSDPRRDWRISQPRPDHGADCWGLVPIALSSLTRTRAVFQPAAAYAVMADLVAAQKRRYWWRQNEAYRVYERLHPKPLEQQPQTPAPLLQDVGRPAASAAAAALAPIEQPAGIQGGENTDSSDAVWAASAVSGWASGPASVTDPSTGSTAEGNVPSSGTSDPSGLAARSSTAASGRASRELSASQGGADAPSDSVYRAAEPPAQEGLAAVPVPAQPTGAVPARPAHAPTVGLTPEEVSTDRDRSTWGSRIRGFLSRWS